MSKLKGLLLTQGMHGMISQVEGLAKALDIDFTHHKVELKNIWKLVPPKFTPISQNVYKKVNDIADLVKKNIGDKVLIEKEESNDNRSYHISSKKFCKI